MSQGSVLPPAPARAADVAVAAGRDGPAAADPAGASFGAVLQAQIDKGLPAADLKSGLLPGVDTTAPTDPAAAVTGQTPIDAALLAAAVAVPVAAPASPVPVSQPAETDTVDRAMKQPALAVDALPVASEAMPKRSDRPATEDKLARPTLVPAAKSEPRSDAQPADPEVQVGAAPVPVPVAAVDGRMREPATDIKATAAPAPTVVESPNPLHPAAEIRRESGMAAPVKVEVTQPLSAPAWRDAFADRVTWVANARQPVAELQINPPQLGPVEIRVSMNADQASLSFFSPHAAVREAIQASLPRLTDAFAASGLTLGNVLVGAESQSGQQPGERETGSRFTGASREDFSAPETATAVTWVRPGGGLGRVDLFA
ncbi:MAG: flagellar hook-length control protein FliK [Burkholderiales bacterium]|nr:flagellar hook-length control protein FliK [Burkholderiales bacterium]